MLINRPIKNAKEKWYLFVKYLIDKKILFTTNVTDTGIVIVRQFYIPGKLLCQILEIKQSTLIYWKQNNKLRPTVLDSAKIDLTDAFNRFLYGEEKAKTEIVKDEYYDIIEVALFLNSESQKLKLAGKDSL